MSLLVIKSIGILPVALALGSFLFLVLLLSYHTLRKSWEALQASKNQYIESGKVQYQIAHQLAMEIQQQGDYINQYDKMISLGGTLMSDAVGIEEALRANKELKKEMDLIRELVLTVPVLQQQEKIKNLLQDFENQEKEYEMAYRKYAYNLKYYNNFVSKMPSKLMAKITGFKAAI
jgi:hypothetical protein